MRQKNSMEIEIKSLIKDMFDCDQGEEEVAHQVTRLFHRYHDEWYNLVRVADQEKEEAQKKCERYEETLKWYGELPCIQDNQIGWNVGYVARQALRKEMKEAIILCPCGESEEYDPQEKGE